MINKKYSIISSITLLSGFLLTYIYRPYIYSNHINDLGFADTIGSLISVLGYCSLIWSFKMYSKKQKNLQIILTTVVYGIIWEFLGYLELYGTFDWKDVIATFFSGALTFFIKELIDNP